ncbi:unnamed protein product [Phytophthora lilii]|uniref:Unnamed protein product n=1 Tax=Phytophthora lilii TaxID=2077276 RepID=A0A9W6UEM4_9STRA|nr:unnamed protein product [Phytophthora lilii]
MRLENANVLVIEVQEELAATQASKAKLYEEIGVLKQTQERQAKQLSKYKLDLQTARESHTVMKKKMETLEQSTSTTKQQYIRCVTSRVCIGAMLACCRMLNSCMYQLEHEQHAQPREELSGAMFISVAATAPHDAVIAVTDKSAPSASNNNGACEKQEEELVQSKLAIEGLQTQVAKLESEYSTLNGTLTKQRESF